VRIRGVALAGLIASEADIPRWDSSAVAARAPEGIAAGVVPYEASPDRPFSYVPLGAPAMSGLPYCVGVDDTQPPPPDCTDSLVHPFGAGP
jgi:hypothetical protein